MRISGALALERELGKGFYAQLMLLQRSLKRDVFGPTPPNLFVGSYGYPQVFAGPMVSVVEENKLGDNPANWFGAGISEIITARASLLRGKKKQEVKVERNAVGEVTDLQLSVISSKPVDLEVRLKREPFLEMEFFPETPPMGPSGEMEKMRLAGNPVIPRKVDSLLGEELKAREAIGELLDKGFEYYYLQKLLSAGVLGIEKKLVPTRWSITAADRMIADLHIRELKEFSELDEIRVYSSAYLHNRFEILLLPGRWEFEQFESWPKGSAWGSVVEYEPFGGRSDYAEKEGGGYYAGRLACAEFLAAKLKRQARVIVFREIDEEYKVPVGVWQVRENCRNAFENPPEKFNTLKEALEFLGKKLKNPVMDYVKKSSVIGQRKLGEY